MKETLALSEMSVFVAAGAILPLNTKKIQHSAQAGGELEALDSIGSPPVATASGWDVLGLHPTMPASVVLAVPSIQSAAAERGRHAPYRVRLHHPRTGHE